MLIHRKKIGSAIAAYVFYYLAHYSVTYIDNPPFETTHTQKKKSCGFVVKLQKKNVMSIDELYYYNAFGVAHEWIVM